MELNQILDSVILRVLNGCCAAAFLGYNICILEDGLQEKYCWYDFLWISGIVLGISLLGIRISVYFFILTFIALGNFLSNGKFKIYWGLKFI